MVKKSQDDNLSKVALDCADKLKGVDNLIPPVPVKNEAAHEAMIYRAVKVGEDLVHEFKRLVSELILKPDFPEPVVSNYWDNILDCAAALAFASGFICIGFAIASSLRGVI